MSRQFMKWVGAAAAVAVLAALGPSSTAVGRAPAGNAAARLFSPTWAPCAPPVVPCALGGRDDFRGIVDIYTQLPGAVAAGTGIIVAGGEVLTNAHVVAGGSQVRVVILNPGSTTGDRVNAVGRVVGADRRHDVAVLRLTDPATGAPLVPPAASLGDSDDLRVGDPVEAVGNAYGSGATGAAPRVSRGRVTALGVSVAVSNDSTGRSSRDRGMIQIDGQVLPGDSGGPLLDRSGRVVGMDTAGEDHGGWAIPIDTVLSVAGRRGWLATTPAPAPSGTPQAPGTAVDARLALAPLPLDTRLGLG